MTDDMVVDKSIAGMRRFQEILRKMPPQSAEIVTGSVAIEKEVKLILQEKFVNPGHLDKLKAIHAISVLEASTTDDWMLQVLAAASAFIELRNTVAHSNVSNFDTNNTKLLDAMEQIGDRPDPGTMQYGSIAIAIITALHLAFGEETISTV